uniref:Uncharacterized protein n=1 Tax=Triticum urartu TaxID=4572 RepID=A0A8R7R4P9_TRIUA
MASRTTPGGLDRAPARASAPVAHAGGVPATSNRNIGSLTTAGSPPSPSTCVHQELAAARV